MRCWAMNLELNGIFLKTRLKSRIGSKINRIEAIFLIFQCGGRAQKCLFKLKYWDWKGLKIILKNQIVQEHFCGVHANMFL